MKPLLFRVGWNIDIDAYGQEHTKCIQKHRQNHLPANATPPSQISDTVIQEILVSWSMKHPKNQALRPPMCFSSFWHFFRTLPNHTHTHIFHLIQRGSTGPNTQKPGLIEVGHVRDPQFAGLDQHLTKIWSASLRDFFAILVGSIYMGEMVDVASNQSYGSGYILSRKLMKSSALFLFLNVSSLAGFVSEDVGTNLGL